MKLWTTILILGTFVWFLPTPLLSQKTAENDLTKQELAGKKLFLQRCSICHLPRLYGDVAPYGPRLEAYFNQPGAEDRAQRAIREGGPRMPGFKYGLKPSEIDEIIEYMKTMKVEGKK